MTAFDEDEQLYSDLDWYAIDRAGRLGQFSTAGHRLLPPSFAANKEMTKNSLRILKIVPINLGTMISVQTSKKTILNSQTRAYLPEQE